MFLRMHYFTELLISLLHGGASQAESIVSQQSPAFLDQGLVLLQESNA